MTITFKKFIAEWDEDDMSTNQRRDDYIEYLIKKKIKQVGSGLYSSVFQHPEDPTTVVKIVDVSSSRNYEKFLDFCYHNKKNKWLPKIKYTTYVSVDGSHYDDYKIIFMEKLETLNKVEWSKFMKKYFGTDDHDEIWDEELERAIHLADKDHDLRDLFIFLLDRFSIDDMDWNYSNWMKRGNQIVCIDPVQG